MATDEIYMTASTVYRIGCEQYLDANADWVGPEMWRWATDALSKTEREIIREEVALEWAGSQDSLVEARKLLSVIA